MKRIHLFEFHDLNWLPKTWRDLFTDALSYFTAHKKIYVPVANLLLPIIKMNKNFTIVDFCSGAGSPIATVINEIDSNTNSKIQVILTDKYPNISAFTRISKESDGRIKFINKPIDATNAPKDLQGFRTFFSSFHHFKEESALAILADAVNKKQGIGIFEFTERKLLLRLVPLFIPLQVWLLLNTPLISPFRWQRILWTYLIPIIPLIFIWDGMVSCLRTYSESKLYKLIKNFEDCEYSWKISQMKSAGPFRIIYLMGYPLNNA